MKTKRVAATSNGFCSGCIYFGKSRGCNNERRDCAKPAPGHKVGTSIFVAHEPRKRNALKAGDVIMTRTGLRIFLRMEQNSFIYVKNDSTEGYIKGLPYATFNSTDCYKYVAPKPREPSKVLKRAAEIFFILQQQDFECNRFGVWVKKGQYSFTPAMWQYCGKELPNRGRGFRINPLFIEK